MFIKHSLKKKSKENAFKAILQRERDITSGEFGVSEKQIGGRNLA